ncbi:mevalonate kinase [Verruconis gallopava]|uniref:Mevalonate kinase n=1 Tax=Verruconis gallopava TaxID=253628 RepID=A0A0D2A4L0_9PEZI|nr:mevalonate kinase [Verruconis gallopava]KIW01723.1 mevalonate kinase [Verruconis gallopava]
MAAPVNGRNGLSNGHTNGVTASISSQDSLVDEMSGTALADPPKRPDAKRKVSSPLMPAFMVSAPGKVIVYGEHAVVHGKAAIAAAISLRSYLLVTFLSKSKRTVSLRFPDISLDHTWNIDDLPWAAFTRPDKKKYYYDLVTSLDEDLLKSLQPHIQCVSPGMREDVRKIHHSSATAFLYLFLSLGSQKSPPCVYTLRSTIPIAAGLGSSATIAVCLSAALLLQVRALSGPHQDQPPDESEKQIERINRWAFVGEMCIHGNPSGVDNTVSSGGKAVLFQRKDYTKPPLVKPLRDFPELPLLLVNTRQSRSTAVEVGKVATLRKNHPVIAEHLLSAIDQVTRSAYNLITQDDFDPDDPKNLKFLGELITVNHGLLVSLGVSHPKLERIRALIDHAGIGWTKLTGAGGGGCAITILKPETIESDSPTSANETPRFSNGRQTPGAKKKHKSKTLVELEQKLKDEGFELFETTLAGDGVGVLWPAVIQNGSGEEGGEEIDQEKFLNAVGNEGIEALVGVQAAGQYSDGEREGWKFWRP